MNEKKKMILIVAIFAAIVIFIGLTSYVGSQQEKKQLEEFYNYFESSEEKLIYFGREGCYYCGLLAPAKQELLDDANVDYYNIDTAEFDSNLLDKILVKLGISTSTFGTPTIVIVKQGKVLNIQGGVFAVEAGEYASVEEANKVEFQKYLEEYNILEKSE